MFKILTLMVLYKLQGNIKLQDIYRFKTYFIMQIKSF